jgi:putative ABC transport system substrate-binding protein
VTGVFLEQIELAAKRLQLVKEAFPAVTKAMAFWDAPSVDQWRATRDNAAKLGFDLAGVELRDYPYDYARALVQAPPEHRGFLFVMTSPLFARDRQRLVQFTLLNQLPSISVFREHADLGGLMSYGTGTRCPGASPTTCIASPAAPSRPNCRSSGRRFSSWSSTNAPPKRSAWSFRKPCCCAPTR